MTSGDDMYETLNSLKRNRGVPGADLVAELGRWFPGDRTQIETALYGLADSLPADLRQVSLGALGLLPEVDERYLAGRLARLAELTRRDTRTVRRWIDRAFQLMAERATELERPPPVPVEDAESVPPVRASSDTGRTSTAAQYPGRRV